ncbi:hypothetical protein PoB_002866800 [Plakobranchus ocellatus]|uniref:Uncharacterized protein n=1 Tax=Plakobranchus ocellatus TaxID=259542 RepID=A0AAV4A620_9GAST|nr:hypothetical protein PoB_002866800 [Plakobranchus ocellatus]
MVQNVDVDLIGSENKCNAQHNGCWLVGCICMACPRHDELRLSGPPPGHDQRRGSNPQQKGHCRSQADSLSSVSPTPLHNRMTFTAHRQYLIPSAGESYWF